MTVVASNKFGWILSPESYIETVYKNTQADGYSKSYILNPRLYSIRLPFKKIKPVREVNSVEIGTVKEGHYHLKKVFDSIVSPCQDKGEQSSKLFADDFYEKLTCHPKVNFYGGNNADVPLLSQISSELYLVPANCSFYCYDIKEVEKHLTGKKFDIILLDPPWWNKYIRRKRKWNAKTGYEMLFDSDLEKVPIYSLLHDDGLVIVWCTNAPSHINTVISQIFPLWGVQYTAQWFWMKVTQSGEAVCPFTEPPGKQPFERIIFGVKKDYVRKYCNPEENKIIMSIPSAVHSHKPPLCELVKPYVEKDPKCLELFARYLLPNWTSYGNEVLKLQHISLYQEVGDKTS